MSVAKISLQVFLLVRFISGWLGTLLMSIKPYFNPRIPIQDSAMDFFSEKRGAFMGQLFGSQRWTGAGYPAHGQQFYPKATCLKRNAMINYLNFRVSHFWTTSDQTSGVFFWFCSLQALILGRIWSAPRAPKEYQ